MSNNLYRKERRIHQQQIKEDRMNKFWVCYVEGSDGGKNYQHPSLELAQQEAERLAMLPDVRGKTVYLFQCVGKCRINTSPVKWEVPREDDSLLSYTTTTSLPTFGFSVCPSCGRDRGLPARPGCPIGSHCRIC